MARKDAKDRGLFQRPPNSGIWWVGVTHEGKTHKYKIGSKAAAKTFYQKCKTEQSEQRFQPERYHKRKAQAVRLSVAIEQVKKAATTTKGAANRKTYAEFWKTTLGDLPVSQITAQKIEAGRATLIEQGKTPATANRYAAFLRRLCSLAVRDGILDASPFRQIRALKEPSGRTRYLTDEEAKKLLEKLPQPSDKAAVIVALNTGLRRAECLRLRWDNIDPDHQVVTVYKTKSGKPRSIPLNDAAMNAIRGLNSWMTSVWLFPSDNPATPIDPDNFYHRVFLPACKEAKLDDVGFHTLRHSFASHLSMAGTDLYTIQRLLGHSTIRMTERYAHLSPTYLKNTVANLPFGRQSEGEKGGEPENQSVPKSVPGTTEVSTDRVSV